MNKATFFLIITGILFLAPGCTKKDSSDPPVVKDPYGMFTYTLKSNGIVSFTNTSTDATSYLWDFGDSTTSSTTTITFEHQYLKNGTYRATLTAYGNGKSAGAYADLNITSVAGTVPTVQTSTITNIAQTTATGGGDVTDDGGSTVSARGVCWSTAQNPTVSDNKTMDGSGTGSFSSDITGLSASTNYYVRAYATNSFGTGYGNEVTFSISSGGFTIGQSYGGGSIFYVDGTGQHGLIAAPSDQSTGTWGCYTVSIAGTSTAIGTGQANTTAIVNGCTGENIAARICYDLVLNGYDDWFLPSKDELTQIYLHKDVISGNPNGCYWSSSENDSDAATTQCFTDGSYYSSYKYFPYNVRAVRAF